MGDRAGSALGNGVHLRVCAFFLEGRYRLAFSIHLGPAKVVAVERSLDSRAPRSEPFLALGMMDARLAGKIKC